MYTNRIRNASKPNVPVDPYQERRHYRGGIRVLNQINKEHVQITYSTQVCEYICGTCDVPNAINVTIK